MIRFGADGWIGIISHDFTFRNLKMVVQALALYLLEADKIHDGVVIGYDTRFLSDEYAAKTAEILASVGIKVYIANKPVITPALSLAVKEFQAYIGIMITASNLAYKYNGLKIKGSYGGPILENKLTVIAGYIGRDVKLKTSEEGQITSFNPDQMYRQQISQLTDLELIKSAGLKIIVDVMYGASKGYLKELIAGDKTQLIEIRNTSNPSFGGSEPSPVEQNLASLKNLIPGFAADLALAFNSDGTQLGVIDDRGYFINSQYIFSLLVKHLVEGKKKQGSVAKTSMITQMINQLAKKYGFDLLETPNGFQYICDLFIQKRIFCGSTGTGGFALEDHVPDQDGILAGLLLMELMVVTELKLSQLVKNLEKEFGKFFWRQLEIPYIWDDQLGLRAISPKNFPQEIAGFPVVSIQKIDGIKFYLEGGSWLLVKPAQNRLALNLYAESSSKEEVENILSAAKNKNFLTTMINY